MLLGLLPSLYIACQYACPEVRYKAACCLAELAATEVGSVAGIPYPDTVQSIQHQVLDSIATTILPFLQDSKNDVRRQVGCLL